ncbi:MAG: head-tail connector protein [Candidatus Atribacteria bacterium]|nr:head-tail connector protein [Candidatus Atribacteria bacterium]
MAGMTKDDVTRCLERLSQKRTDRKQSESVWQEIRDYMLPNRPSFLSQTVAGAKTMEKIYDGTAIDAINVCKAGISGMLTNAALPWHGIEMTDETLNKNPDIQNALSEVNEVMSREYHSSNFYTNIDGVYEEVIGFGESGLFIGEGKKTALNFMPIPLNQIFTDEDSEGNVDTVFRCRKMTARQAKQEWPKSSLTTQMSDALTKTGDARDKEFDIVHVVYPRSDRELDKKGNYKQDKKNKPFLSAYIAEEEKVVLDEGGYEEMPYAIPRLFLMSGDGYGRGMGWNALPDVKMLNTMERTGLRAWQKATDPPLVLPDEGYSLPVKTGPGGVTYNSNWDKQGAEPRTLYGSGQFQMLPNFEQKCEQKRNQIREFFFYKQFRTQQEGQPRTAQEIIQIASENLKILGPLLNRFMEELLKTIIIRSFWILYRRGKFPKLIQVMASTQGVLDFKIVYLSPIAKAQRLYESQELQNAFTMLLPAAQIKPEMVDRISGDKFFETISELYPALRKVTETPTKVKEIRAQRAQAAADAKMTQDVGNVLQGAQIASETDPNAGLLAGLAGNVGTGRTV